MASTSVALCVGRRWQGLLGAAVALVVSLCPCPSHASAIAFTGFVDADFAGPGVVIATDAVGDIGLPPEASGYNAWSGWDVQELRFSLDTLTDTLYVGVRMPINALADPDRHVIFGDADGDGDPANTEDWLSSLVGVDVANLGSGEFFALLLDVDQSGTYDALVGVRNPDSISDFGIFRYVAGGWNVDTSFGSRLDPLDHTASYYMSPDSLHPDLEFTITHFSALGPTLGLPDPEPLRFATILHAGSGVDAGIPEETAPQSVAFVPEPAAGLLLGLPLVALLVCRRRRAQ